jgi:(R,R)-butanediol dehydrogenase / meso-butanediol dehydrogenase / diacetyl reductase
MKAAIWHAKHDVRVEDVPAPAGPGPGEAVVQVALCGICGTDLHEYTDGPQYIPLQPHPLTGASAPVIMGHELAGTVVEVGPGVTRAGPGDRVAVNPIQSCQDCAACRRGQNYLCKTFAGLGLHTRFGGFGRLVVVKDYQLFPIPDALSWRQGAVTEPACVATHAVDRGGVKPGDTVLITGGGPIGQLAGMAARVAGASRIYISEVAPHRRELAERNVEPTRVLDPARDSVADALREVTDGWGADVTIEASASDRGLADAISATRNGGTIVQVAVFTKPVSIHPASALTNVEKSLVGTLCYHPSDWPRVMDLMASGQLPAERVVTAEIPLVDILELGFDELTRPDNKQGKVLVQPE